MKLFFHFSVVRFANTYLLGPDEGGDALLIDPGVMNTELLKLIEGCNYYIRHIFLTHSHDTHTKGIKTLLKIYDATIHSYLPEVLDIDTSPFGDGEIRKAGNIAVEAVHIEGHSSDSLVFKVNEMVFTGDVLMAGKIGRTQNSWSKSLLLQSIRDKLYHLDDSTLIFPGHGPPTTLKAEKMFNPDLKLLERL